MGRLQRSKEELIEQCDHEIAACENGTHGEHPLWVYGMTWADWMIERELIAKS